MSQVIKAWIIDDEIASQELISGLLEHYYPDIEILGYSINIDDAFDQIKLNKPNLVYLDINLPRGNGINFLERFPIRKFEVIVISGYPDNEPKLERFRDIPFLRKPISIEEFRKHTEHAIKEIINDPYRVHRYD